MKENVIIRNERKEDWEIVETITRQAFYIVRRGIKRRL